MKKKSHLSAAGVLAILAFSTPLLAQNQALPNTPNPNAPAPRQAGKLSHADRNFFEEAAKSGMKEVEVSNAVKGRLANAQVREFAVMMASDHSAANSELQALAAAKGVALPAAKKDFTQKWTKKDGDIDEDYVETMEEDHEEAVKLFEKASKSDDPEIAAFAQKTLPKLRQHLETVRTLKRTVK